MYSCVYRTAFLFAVAREMVLLGNRELKTKEEQHEESLKKTEVERRKKKKNIKKWKEKKPPLVFERQVEILTESDMEKERSEEKQEKEEMMKEVEEEREMTNTADKKRWMEDLLADDEKNIQNELSFICSLCQFN